MSDAAGVEGRADTPSLAGLFSDVVRVASAPIEDHREALLPEEREAIAQARASRQREFATGRHLARILLRQLGAGEVAIPRNPDRTACWPIGWVGSITHSEHVCAVVAARASDCLGLGIDLEPDRAVKPGLERMICFGDELAWIAAEGEGARGRRCRMVFSAKEAVYKAFHPRTRRVWRFEEVALEIDLAGARFEARLPSDAGPAAITGRMVCRAGFIVSGVEWSPDDAEHATGRTR